MNRLVFRWFGWLLCFVITVVLCERSYAIVRAEPLGPIEWMDLGATADAPSEPAEMSLSSPETGNSAPNLSDGATPPAAAQSSLPRVQFLPLLMSFYCGDQPSAKLPLWRYRRCSAEEVARPARRRVVSGLLG